MTYNLTNITNSNDLYNIVLYTNQLSGDLFFSSLILILFILYIVIYKGQKFRQVLPAAAFFIIVVSTYAFAMGLVGVKVLITSAIVFFASLLVMYFVN